MGKTHHRSPHLLASVLGKRYRLAMELWVGRWGAVRCGNINGGQWLNRPSILCWKQCNVSDWQLAKREDKNLLLMSQQSYLYIIYKTEIFETPTIFHVNIILKKKKKRNRTFLKPDSAFPFHEDSTFPFHDDMPKPKLAPQIPDLHLWQTKCKPFLFPPPFPFSFLQNKDPPLFLPPKQKTKSRLLAN